MEIEQKQKTLPVIITRVKCKQIDEEVTNTKNKKFNRERNQIDLLYES